MKALRSQTSLAPSSRFAGDFATDFVGSAPGVVLTIEDFLCVFEAMNVVPRVDSKSAPMLVSAILAVVLTAASLPMTATMGVDFGGASFFDFWLFSGCLETPRFRFLTK